MTESSLVNPYAMDPLDLFRAYLDPEIAGEEANKGLLSLVCLSSQMLEPLSAIVKGPSSAGKSHLVNKVIEPWRRMGKVIEYTRLTPAFLDNMASKDHAPKPLRRGDVDFTYEERLLEWKNQPRKLDVRGKIFYIGELGGIQNSQAPKLLISEGRLRLGTVINNEPVEIEVIGIPTFITTTTQSVLEDPELENRVLPIEIDETREQTRNVLDHEAGRLADPITSLKNPALERLMEFLQSLKPYGVAIPFAHELAKKFPDKNLVARRDYLKMGRLVNAMAFLNQHNRRRATKLADIVVLAQREDLENVMRIAWPSLSQSLSGRSEKEKVIHDYLVEHPGPLTVREISDATHAKTRRSVEWTRAHLKRLSLEGYVEEIPIGNNRFQYQATDLEPDKLELTSDYKDGLAQEWASTFGYRFVETPNTAKPASFELDGTKEFHKGHSWNSLVAKPQIMAENAGNGDSYNSKPGVGIPCPRCRITWPDQPSFDNHLDTYKHAT